MWKSCAVTAAVAASLGVLAGCPSDAADNDPTLWLSLDDRSPTPEREVRLVPFEPPPF